MKSYDYSVINYKTLISCILILSTCIMSVWGVYLSKKIGIRITLTIGLIFILSANCLICSFTNVITYYLYNVVSALGMGLISLASVKETIKKFETRHGALFGLIFTGRVLGNIIFNYLGEKIINPQELQKDGSGIYPESVAENVTRYLPIVITIYSLSGFLAIILSYKVDAMIDQSLKKLDFLRCSVNSFNLLDKEASVNSSNSNSLAIPKRSEKLRYALLSRKFIAISCLAFCLNCIIYFNICSGFPYIFSGLANDNALSPSVFGENIYLLIIFYQALGSIIWGSITDLCSIRAALYVMIYLGIFISGTMGFAVDYNWICFIYSLITASLIGGSLSLFSSLCLKLFGIKNSTQLFSVVQLFIGVSKIISCILDENLNHLEEKGDFILFWIGTFFMIIGMILCFVLKETKFNYRMKKGMKL